jgi:hypothetical protein
VCKIASLEREKSLVSFAFLFFLLYIGYSLVVNA